MESKRIVVACGGTGGHLFPGLAVARELQRRGHNVEVWIAGRDIEQHALHSWQGTIFATGTRPFSLKSLPAIIRALRNSIKRLKKFRPELLLAMGCYSSLPPVLAAKHLKIPIILHEANAIPGKAVDFLSRYAAMTALSFKETISWLPGRAVRVTGLPVRDDLAGQPPFEEIPSESFTLFITGGSQGAQQINHLASRAVLLLKEQGIENLFIIHQCGTAEEASLKELYAQAGIKALVAAFIPSMGQAYSSADLVISRAGAATCAELCLLGKPALLIPLPSAVRDHQNLNALALVRAGSADKAIQKELSPASLMRYIKNKIDNPILLKRMSQAGCNLALPQAANNLVNLIEELVKAQSSD